MLNAKYFRNIYEREITKIQVLEAYGGPWSEWMTLEQFKKKYKDKKVYSFQTREVWKIKNE